MSDVSQGDERGRGVRCSVKVAFRAAIWSLLSSRPTLDLHNGFVRHRCQPRLALLCRRRASHNALSSEFSETNHCTDVRLSASEPLEDPNGLLVPFLLVRLTHRDTLRLLAACFERGVAVEAVHNSTI